MTTNKSSNEDPKLGRTLKNDFSQVDFIGEIKKEFRELKNFYIDEQKKERLRNMNSASGGIHVFIWLLKSLFFRLNPFRRVISVLGVIFFLFGRVTVANTGSNSAVIDLSTIGGIMILFVLMLELKDKLLAKTELEGGRKVQKALLPEENPQIAGWKVWLYSRPANEVCGDLVDYLKLSDLHIGLTMADVAGKGLSAALMMSKLQATVRAIANEKDALSKLAENVNHIFHRDSLPSLFASMIYIQVIPDKGKLKYVNAGHLPPLILKGDTVEELPKGDAAIGIIKDSKFKEQKIELKKGEVLIVYSDGVTEATNEIGQFFGKDRLFNTIKKYKDLTVDKLGEAITRQVEFFCGDAPRSDDLSLIILKRE
jgi:sigma-B regulation protein RsbU (phosphoserine phosphatase)